MSKSDPLHLKARFVVSVQTDPEMVAAMKVAPESLPRSTLLKLLRDYDRRLAQVYDKVAFERKLNLVDYSTLKK